MPCGAVASMQDMHGRRAPATDRIGKASAASTIYKMYTVIHIRAHTRRAIAPSSALPQPAHRVAPAVLSRNTLADVLILRKERRDRIAPEQSSKLRIELNLINKCLQNTVVLFSRVTMHCSRPQPPSSYAASASHASQGVPRFTHGKFSTHVQSTSQRGACSPAAAHPLFPSFTDTCRRAQRVTAGPLRSLKRPICKVAKADLYERS